MITYSSPYTIAISDIIVSVTFRTDSIDLVQEKRLLGIIIELWVWVDSSVCIPMVW